MKNQFRYSLLLAFLVQGITLCAQDIRFEAYWGINPLHRDSLTDEGWRITDLRSYISDLNISTSNDSVWHDPVPAYLIDWLDTTRNRIQIPVMVNDTTTRLCFTIGLDSALNCSGIQRGVLDPVNGMYWTWQSGFIHLRLEAISPQGKAVELHLGGYRYPHAAIQSTCFSFSRLKKTICVRMNVQALIDYMQEKGIDHIMSPGQAAKAGIEKAAAALVVEDNP